jgi:hypothetical protein
VPPRLARNTIIESTFHVGCRFRCTMRVDCGQLDPQLVIRPEPGEWHPRMPECLDEEELADWRAGRNAVYQGTPFSEAGWYKLIFSIRFSAMLLNAVLDRERRYTSGRKGPR